MLRSVICHNIVTDKTGRKRVCGRRLADVDGAYRIICPKCHGLCEGDTNNEKGVTGNGVHIERAIRSSAY